MSRRGIILALLLAALCLALCSGCGEKVLSGEVVEYRTDESGALSALVVKPEAGARVGFLLSEESWVWALTEGITAEEFAAEQPEGVYVSAETAGRAQTITAGDGTEIDAYPVETVKLTALRTDTVFPLSDGNQAILWSNGRYWSYRLEDGTELLWEDPQLSPTFRSGEGELPEAAQESIRAYYREQGLLYDVPELLETAYQDYLREEGSFDGYHAGQDISQSAVTERVAYFTTAVTLPLDSQEVTELRLGAAFDRETGAQLALEELLTCPAEDFLAAFLDAAQLTEQPLRTEMEAAFRSEYAIFLPDGMELSFPQGSLPSQEHSFIVHEDYIPELQPLFQPWALPAALRASK